MQKCHWNTSIRLRTMAWMGKKQMFTLWNIPLFRCFAFSLEWTKKKKTTKIKSFAQRSAYKSTIIRAVREHSSIIIVVDSKALGCFRIVALICVRFAYFKQFVSTTIFASVDPSYFFVSFSFVQQKPCGRQHNVKYLKDTAIRMSFCKVNKIELSLVHLAFVRRLIFCWYEVFAQHRLQMLSIALHATLPCAYHRNQVCCTTIV